MTMSIKRDRVNRVSGLVYLPIDGSSLYKGRIIELTAVKESSIDCETRDPMEMDSPYTGDAIGDAIFDAMLEVNSRPQVLGHVYNQDSEVLGNPSIMQVLGTGGYMYIGGESQNICDAHLEDYGIFDLTTEDGISLTDEDGLVLIKEYKEPWSSTSGE